jgi:Arc/MetJ-type ribon-helix-helix transcriptional regulator
MSVQLNQAAVRYAQQLIKDGKFKNDSGHWREHNPDTAAENKFLDKHEIEEYAKWHLGEDTSAGEDTKGRYKFPFGDFKTVHRDGLLAAKERAAQQGYHDIEKAAAELEEALEKQASK